MDNGICMLLELVMRDPLSLILAYIRLKLQQEYKILCAPVVGTLMRMSNPWAGLALSCRSLRQACASARIAQAYYEHHNFYKIYKTGINTRSGSSARHNILFKYTSDADMHMQKIMPVDDHNKAVLNIVFHSANGFILYIKYIKWPEAVPSDNVQRYCNEATPKNLKRFVKRALADHRNLYDILRIKLADNKLLVDHLCKRRLEYNGIIAVIAASILNKIILGYMAAYGRDQAEDYKPKRL